MIKTLEERLRNYDKVLLVKGSEFFEGFDQLKTFEHITFQKISEDEFQELLELYLTYEFSDKFFFIFDGDINYANLYHMVDVGILNLEDFFAALLS
ncbi:MAG: hypothetical protein HFG68_13590 [Hungatella sp.]|nr:hypothetical protein [Hungatella sp.]